MSAWLQVPIQSDNEVRQDGAEKISEAVAVSITFYFLSFCCDSILACNLTEIYFFQEPTPATAEE